MKKIIKKLNKRNIQGYLVNDRKEALNRCEGAVYEVETIHRIKRIK